MRLFPAWGVLLALLLAGCAGVRHGHVSPSAPVEGETAYIVPFVTTLVPESVAEEAFNDFVDALNDRKPIRGIQSYVILKDDPTVLNREWLSRQFVISGEIWSYQENSGCCSTELRIRARLSLPAGGGPSSPRTVTVPVDRFFEHDYSSLSLERERLARDLARALYRALLEGLAR